MSCIHKRPKRSEEEERAFQEHVKKVAQENGKRLGRSSPHSLPMGSVCAWHFGLLCESDARLCVKISASLQRKKVCV